MDIRDCWKGQRVVWRTVPRGGYGYMLVIPVTVLKVLDHRVRVRVENDGTVKTVNPASLRIPKHGRNGGYDPKLEPKP